MNSQQLPSLEASGEFDHGISDPIIMEGRDFKGKKKDDFSPAQLKDALWSTERAFDKATKKICDGVGHFVEGMIHRRGGSTSADSRTKKSDTMRRHDYSEEDDTESFCTDPEWILFYGLERS